MFLERRIKMCEKIKNIKTIAIGNNFLDVELNEATLKGGNRWIHLQNEVLRVQFSEDDFTKILTCILKAEERLKYNKKEERET